MFLPEDNYRKIDEVATRKKNALFKDVQWMVDVFANDDKTTPGGLVGMLSEIVNKVLNKKFGTFSKLMSLLRHILLFLRQCADFQKLQKIATVTQ